MTTQQGDLALLNQPLAQELLHAAVPARLAYVWPDGSPRVVPIWFHWTGQELVFSSPPGAPKLKALHSGSPVAATIDTEGWPNKVLLVRGIVQVQTVEGVPAEYAAAAERYLGQEQGRAWVAQLRQMSPQGVRIALQPHWVGLIDFQTRFPSAIEAAMASVGALGR